MKRRIFSAARLTFHLASAIVAALVSTPSASATPYFWTGATNGTWNTTTNWSGSLVPLIPDDLTILGPLNVAGALTINFDADNSARSLNFTNTAATAITNTTSGANKTLTLGSGGITTGAGAVTIGSITANQAVNITLGAAQTWNIGAGGMTVSNVISGAGTGITKTGAGNLTINTGAVNGFTGGLNVNGGTVTLDYTNLATPTDLIAASNALQLNNGVLTITGRNVAAATTAQTFAGTSLGEGVNTVNIAKGALATSATLNLGALTVNPGAGTTFSPTTAWTTTASTTERVFISAGGSVPTLPSGATTEFVNAGVFHRAAGGAAGTLRLAAVNSSGQLLLKANAGNLAVGTGVDPTGSYQLAAGSIALTNTGASVYGLLLNATGAGTNITIADSGTLTLNSVIQIKATESVNINAGTGVSNVVIGSERNLVLAMDNTAGLAINAPIANNGSSGGTGGTASAITIVGNTSITPGNVTLGGANTYTGPTTITRGTLALSNANALATTSGLTLGGTSAATLSNSGDVNNIIINGAITAANSGVTSTIAYGRTTSAQGSITLNGGITGGGGNVTFTTPNVSSGGNLQTIVLGGGVGSAGGYGGNTTLTTGNVGNAITLRSGIDNALPTTTVLTFAQNNGSGSGRTTTFDLNGNNQTLAGLSNTGVVAENRNMTVTSASAATLTINSTANHTFGGRTISTVQANTGVNTRAQISGAISLVKSGTGTFTLGGTLAGGAVAAGNTFTGSTQILGGILVLGESLSIQNSAFDTTSVLGGVSDGLRAGIGGTGVTALTLGGLTGGNNFSTRFTSTTGGYTNLTALTLNPVLGATHTYSGDIGNGNGSMSLSKSNEGIQVLTNTNSYTGTTTINRGTLRINSIDDYSAPSSIGSPAGGDLVIGSANTGVLDYVGSGDSSNRTITVGSSTAAHAGGAFILANGGAALTFTATTFYTAQTAATAARTLTLGGGGIGAVNGTIQDNNTAGGGIVAVTKQEAGTWTLSGANTYTGATTVTAGTLQLSGATGALSGTSGVSINGGNLLLTGGTANSRLADGATLSLGNAAANSQLQLGNATTVTETFGALSLTPGGTGIRVLDFGGNPGSQLTFASLTGTAATPLEIWNWTGGTDQLNFLSTTLGGTMTLDLVNFYSDSNSGGTGTLATGAPGAQFVGNELVPVPEPSFLLATSALGAAALFRRRRRAL